MDEIPGELVSDIDGDCDIVCSGLSDNVTPRLGVELPLEDVDCDRCAVLLVEYVSDSVNEEDLVVESSEDSVELSEFDNARVPDAVIDEVRVTLQVWVGSAVAEAVGVVDVDTVALCDCVSAKDSVAVFG